MIAFLLRRFVGALILPILFSGSAAFAQAPTSTAQGQVIDGAYSVVAGDTLYGISTRFGLTVAQMVSANDLGSNATLYVGQPLVFPGAAPAQSSTIPTTRATTTLNTAASGNHTIQRGETLYSISRLHGVSVAALTATNSISDPSQLFVGQVLQIPGQQVVTPTQAATTTQVVAAPVTGPRTHTVTPGQTLYAISRLHSVDVATLVAANGLSDPGQIHVGQVLTISGDTGFAAGMQVPSQTVVAAASSQAGAGTYLGEVGDVHLPPQRVATTGTPEPIPTANSAAAASTQSDSSDAVVVTVSNAPATPVMLPSPPPRRSSKFHWPARGRITKRFGSQGNGQTSDGIEIEVASGSNILAAEDGVVAFAGTGVSGYGYLVLIKHADDYYTAYAQNSAVTVQRGDVVTRGSLIARAGNRTIGSNGRLHFEVRYKEEPVNPVRYMVN